MSGRAPGRSLLLCAVCCCAEFARGQAPESRRLDREPDLGGRPAAEARRFPPVDATKEEGAPPSPSASSDDAAFDRDLATENAVDAAELRDRLGGSGRPSAKQRVRGAVAVVFAAGALFLIALATRLLRARKP